MLARVEYQYQFSWTRYKELELEIGKAILLQTELKKPHLPLHFNIASR
jgi:hypothetical protein